MTEPLDFRDVKIRRCSNLGEYDECVRLQQRVWGKDMAVPSAIFVVAHHTGGQVLGAFQQDHLVGFSLALAATRAGKLFLHSHMTAVLPESVDRGVGRCLKLFQRQDAMERGIDLIEWTFDPLELKNAHFNLVRLGAVARRLIPDCYGVTPSPLHAGLPTDRLVAEWWLNSDRVKSIIAANPLPIADLRERVSFPSNLAEIKANGAAGDIQGKARERFQKLFAQGYVATGFRSAHSSVHYVLEPASGIAGLVVPPFIED
jgi:predicted GNAT superfamily acetyltransferase